MAKENINFKEKYAILEENREEAVSIISALPKADYIKDLLKALDMPYKLKHIGISKKNLKDSIKYADNSVCGYGALCVKLEVGKSKSQ